ncbi:MAG: DNA-3-methyladenine glycosylase 2 family protein [Enterobacteriaceae bacterium]
MRAIFCTTPYREGIFCRTICPAKLPHEKSVSYYFSATAAMADGYRPCLRCRPDSAPHSYFWNEGGSLAVIAARMIEQGALQQGDLQQLASKLGISNRYLHKLFVREYGVGPKRYDLLQRCLFAKNLLQESALSITQVAHASGFNSISLFNHHIRQFLGFSPSQLRKQNSRSKPQDLTLFLDYRPPFNWTFLLRFLSQRLIPGLEWIDNERYGRTFRYLNTRGCFSVHNEETRSRLVLSLQLDNLRHLQPIIANIRRIFDVDAHILAIETLLQKQAPNLLLHSGIRMPGTWNLFEAGIRAICGQQVSIKAAHDLVNQIVRLAGQKLDQQHYLFPEAGDMLTLDLSLLRTTQRRKETLLAFAKWYLNADEPDAVEQWQSIKGIGPWTVNYVKLRGLSDPDIWLSGDLGIQKALAVTGEIDASQFRPWRSYLTYHLWSHLYV